MRMMRNVVREKQKDEERIANSTKNVTNAKTNSDTTTTSSFSPSVVEENYDDRERRILSETLATCPLSREDLGTATWGLMHSVAAHFPDNPSSLHKVQVRRFFYALGDLYPCTFCKEDFKEDVKRNPPNVLSREALSVWVCERHNEVNEKLGKPKLECTLEVLDKRWRDGGTRCRGGG